MLYLEDYLESKCPFVLVADVSENVFINISHYSWLLFSLHACFDKLAHTSSEKPIC